MRYLPTFDPSGMVCALAWSPEIEQMRAVHEARRLLCPLCFTDTRWCGSEDLGGYCGRCGGRFEYPIGDREWVGYEVSCKQIGGA